MIPRAAARLASALLLVQASLVAMPTAAQMAPATADPGDYVHEVWTIEDGLPVNQVTAALQSRSGYLWLATFDGLVRFDGIRFTVYTTGTHLGLPSNRIVALHEARDGALWLVHEYNWVTRFTEGTFTSFGPDQGLRGSPTFAIHEDRDGVVWVGTERDVVAYRDGRMVPLGPEPLNANVVALHRDQSGVLWIGTFRKGLYRFDGGLVSHEEGALSRGAVLDFYEAPDGAVWIASSNGVYRSRGGTLEAISPSLAARGFVVPDDPSAPIVTASEGAFRYRDGRFEDLHLEGWDPTFLVVTAVGPQGDPWMASGPRLFRGADRVLDGVGEIRALVFDHEGSLWIGARGLHRLKPALFHIYGAREGGVDNVYPIHEDPDGTLWFGSFDGGLARFADGRFTRYPGIPDGLPGSLVLAIHRDTHGDLWVGSYGGSLCPFRPGLPCERPPGLGGENVRAIHRDRRGTLWVGADVGLFWWHDGAMQRPPGAAVLEGRVVRVIHESGDGTLWFGTNGAGLMRYRAGAGFEPFTTSHGLSSDLIRSIYEDVRGVLWIGSEGRGLNRLEVPPDGDLANAKVAVYRQRDGLYEEVIHQILEDDFGRLWMSTNRGIFWVDRAELDAFARGEVDRIHSTHYTERDGLRNREANGGVNSAGVKARDGRLWFATQAGVAVVDPANIRRNPVPPAVVIEGVAAAGSTHAVVGDLVRLEPGTRDFSISYTGLSFLAPENVRFRYRLEGLDREWVEAGNRRAAFYTNVPPGRYVFRVRASNNDGVWNEAGASLPLSVAPFVYQTVWFRALAILVLLGAIAGTIGLRVRGTRRRQRELVSLVAQRTRALREEKEASEAARREAERQSRVAEDALRTVAAQTEQLQELDRAKSRFFANVSHEFRTPLTLMIGPLEDLRAGLHGAVPEEMDREVVVALRNARRLLQLVEQLLDVARLEASRIEVRAQPGDLVALLRNLVLAFSPVAERRRITVRLDEPARPALVYFDPDLIEKVFANLLSNAFKYTPEDGNVRVTVRVTVPVPGHPDFAEMPDGHITVEVKDSGPGIPAADVPHVFERFYRARVPDDTGGTGIGLSLAHELTELHHGRIEVESEEGFGATFTVILPLGHRHFAASQLVQDDGNRERVSQTGLGRGALAAVDGPAERDDPSVDLAGDEERPTVLLIDDNVELRRFVAKHLHQAGYRVVEAAEGGEGLATARELVPDCIISDIMMPGMDGHALCRALRSDRELDFVPLVLLTARAEREHRLEGLADGADDYLTKPFDIAELRARVENLIASRNRLRDRFRARTSLHPSPVDAVSTDDAFLRQVRDALEAHLGDSEFSVDHLARTVSQSRSQLYRRLQELVGQTPSEALLQFRLERGADLLAARAGTVSEIAYGVGFKSVSHFCRRFRARFGVTPSAYGAAASSFSPTSSP